VAAKKTKSKKAKPRKAKSTKSRKTAKPRAAKKVTAARKSRTKSPKPRRKSVSAPLKRSDTRRDERASEAYSSRTSQRSERGSNAVAGLFKGALVPVKDGVLVERVQDSDRTPGGLYIPLSAMEKPLKGRVVLAGKGKFNKKGKFRPLDVKAGDEVLFGKYAGTEVTVDGREYLLVKEDEILGVV
jgi:chaperonin GroES